MYSGKLFFFILIVFLPVGQSYAQPHSHGARSHSHGLPTQGIQHQHGGGAYGKQLKGKVIPKNTHSKGSYTKDQKGCLHFNRNPEPNDAIVWNGKCINGYSEGRGQQQWYENKKATFHYNGAKKRGMYHGQGTYKRPDGKKYVGNFSNGKEHGKGTIYYKNGNKYVGYFINGKGNGQGSYQYRNGTKYVGNFKDNTFNGHGTLISGAGVKYVGNFKNGKMHGQGVASHVSGSGRKVAVVHNEGVLVNNKLLTPTSSFDKKHHAQFDRCFASYNKIKRLQQEKLDKGEKFRTAWDAIDGVKYKKTRSDRKIENESNNFESLSCYKMNKDFMLKKCQQSNKYNRFCSNML